MPEVLTPPTGWTITAATPGRAARVALDLADVNRDNIQERFTALRDWATENGRLLVPEDYDCITYVPGTMNIYCWTHFKLQRQVDPANESVIGAFPCTGCARELAVGQIYCDSCDRFVVCDECHLAGLRLYGTPGQQTAGTCAACSVECDKDGCINRLSRSDEYKSCSTCVPRGTCRGCANTVPLEQLTQHAGDEGTYLVCAACSVHVCLECDLFGNDVADRQILGSTKHICDKCAQVYYDRERAAFEKWGDDELPVGGTLLIPSSTERPVRTISLETEFDGDGAKVGRALHSAKLLPAAERDRYTTQGEAKGRYPCMLKSDASVTGGELVTYLIDLDNEKHAAALMRVTEVMRGCRELGLAQFTIRAGGHVHIDLHGLTAKDLWAQYTVYKYLELVIYHLAGAGAAYGHRALEGSTYCNPGPDGPFGTVGKFATKMLRNHGHDYRYALHFNNFASAKERCKCGAYMTGEWAECECNLGKATAEWRVFNAEINPRILHGWLAFVQALTAYTTDMENFNEPDFPALPWDGKKLTAVGSGKKNQIKERLEFIFRELPLTVHERDSLIYALKRSALVVLGEDYLNDLINVEQVGGFGAKKAAPNPGSRKEVVFAIDGGTGPVEVTEYDGDEDPEWDEVDLEPDDEF